MPKMTGSGLQFAAMPLRLRQDGSLEVALVTTRETRRWIIPKGWPMKGRKPWQVAALEARQEAGLLGTVERKPLGSFSYFKRREGAFEVCDVMVFVLWVTGQKERFRERAERSVLWVSIEEAIIAVDEPGLKQVLALAIQKVA